MPRNKKEKPRIAHSRAKTFILITPAEEDYTQARVYNCLRANKLNPLHVSLKKKTYYTNYYMVYFLEYQNISNLQNIDPEFTWWTLYHYNQSFPKQRFYKDPVEYAKVLNLQHQVNIAMNIREIERQKQIEFTDEEINKIFEEYEDDLEMINAAYQIENPDFDPLQQVGQEILDSAPQIPLNVYKRIFKVVE